MHRKKMAILFSSLFLLTNIILPGLVFAADTTSLGTLTLGGTKDVWYDGYGIPASSIQNLTFKDDNVLCNEKANVVVSATQAVHSYSSENCGNIDRSDLVGIINYSNSAWTLKVQANTNFTGPGGAVIPIASNLYVVTVGDDFHAGDFDGVVTNVSADDTTLVNMDADGVFFKEAEGSGYTYTLGDVIADVDAAGVALNLYDTYTASGANVTTAGVTILHTVQTDAFGIFAAAPAYQLTIPAGSPAVTYTNTFTYTVS